MRTSCWAGSRLNELCINGLHEAHRLDGSWLLELPEVALTSQIKSWWELLTHAIQTHTLVRATRPTNAISGSVFVGYHCHFLLTDNSKSFLILLTNVQLVRGITLKSMGGTSHHSKHLQTRSLFSAAVTQWIECSGWHSSMCFSFFPSPLHLVLSCLVNLLESIKAAFLSFSCLGSHLPFSPASFCSMRRGGKEHSGGTSCLYMPHCTVTPPVSLLIHISVCLSVRRHDFCINCHPQLSRLTVDVSLSYVFVFPASSYSTLFKVFVANNKLKHSKKVIVNCVKRCCFKECTPVVFQI